MKNEAMNEDKVKAEKIFVFLGLKLYNILLLMKSLI